MMSEAATEHFLKDDRATVSGIIIAGVAELKDALNKQDILDPRLHSLVLGIVDIAYGGTMGFTQAIQNTLGLIQDVSIRDENTILQMFFRQHR